MKNATRSHRKEPAQIAWADAGELRLVLGVLDRSDRSAREAAWRELARRYKHAVEHRVDHVLMHICRLLLSDEVREEIRAEALASLVENDMAHLRRFDPKRTTLVDWLQLHGQRVAIHQLNRYLSTVEMLTSDRANIEQLATLEGLDGCEPVVTERRHAGGEWLGRGR